MQEDGLAVSARGSRRLTPEVAHYREVFPVLTETFIRETVTRHQRYRPYVITHLAQDRPEVPGVDVHELPRGRPTGLSRVSAAVRLAVRSRLLHRELSATRPAVIHAHFGEEGVVAAGPARRLGIPLVAAFYGYDATELARHAVWRRRFRRLFRSAAAVLAEGPHMAARLIELGARHDTVLIHPIPIRLEAFPFRPVAPPANGDALVLLQACRFVEKKGVDTTIDAFARIADAVPAAVLWLMGSGPEEARLRSLAESTGVAGRITFLPPQPHQEYAEVLRRAHVFVHPSRTAANGDGEGGAPTSLLEAQALGLPIVATTHADIPAVVDPDAALLAAPGDADALAALLLRLLRSPDEWAGRSQAGRRNVEVRHDPARLAAALEDLYDRVRA
jgi:colanic acid/amylovoran biosynthesis glycosyltransferase